MKIGISTSAIYGFSQDINEILCAIKNEINYLKYLEIALHNGPLETLNLSKQNIAWLTSLDYVSFHPVKLSDKNLEKLGDIYHNILARNITFHPEDLPKQTNNALIGCQISIENLEHSNWKDLARMMIAENENLKFTLDVSHSFQISQFETANLIEMFSSRLEQIHLSAIEHQSLNKAPHTFLESIACLKGLNQPMFIECNFLDNIQLLRKEITIWEDYFND